MIDEEKTFQMFGYTSDSLKPYSRQPVCFVCDGCGEENIMNYDTYTKRKRSDFCRRCGIKEAHRIDPAIRERQSVIAKKQYVADPTRSTRQSIAQKQSYINDPTLRQRKSDAAKKAHENDPTIRKRTADSIRKAYAANPNLGKHKSIIGKKVYVDDPKLVERLSAIQQHIPYEEWDGFANPDKYCHKFNGDCREHNRSKYDNTCFMCGVSESDNIGSDGKQRALSVHHVDMNKDQGCDDHDWKLVPLCMYCHGIAHTPTWQTRIEYMLYNVWVHPQ